MSVPRLCGADSAGSFPVFVPLANGTPVCPEPQHAVTTPGLLGPVAVGLVV